MPSHQGHLVTAVVVTYRRPVLLARCLRAINAQSVRANRVIVIDNCSGDDTPDTVRSVMPTAELVTMPENTGGAGGFYEGIDRAMKTGAEWLWLMDDDGVPSTTCLQQLLEFHPETTRVRGALVCSERDSKQLAFQLRSPNGTTLRTVEAVEQHSRGAAIVGSCNPFNGVLLHRSVPERVGLPIRDMFIWGDEVEYFSRIASAGFNPITVTKARFIHPPDAKATRELKLLGYTMNVTVAKDPSRQRIYVRNYAYIAWRHQGALAFFRHATKYCMLSFRTGGLRSCWETAAYCVDGLRANWTL